MWAHLQHAASIGAISPRAMLAILAILAIFARASAALADTELGHDGKTGRHRLADMYESPGAVCDIVLPGPDSLGETWIRINPPIVFARDRTSGIDRQRVGWRAVVSALDERTGEWRVVRQSPIAHDMANDNLASYFDGQGWLAEFPVARGAYSATVEMFWYAPDDPMRIEGRALHGIEHFLVFLRHNGEVSNGRTSSVCRPPR